MKYVMMLKLVNEFFDYLYVNEFYNDIQYIIFVKYIYNNHVKLFQFHLDLENKIYLNKKNQVNFTC